MNNLLITIIQDTLIQLSQSSFDVIIVIIVRDVRLFDLCLLNENLSNII